MIKKVIFLFFISYFISGCASPAYRDVFKEVPSYNQKEFNLSEDIIYQATIKAICSKSFIIEKEDKEEGFILGKRYFQKGKRNIVLALQAKIVSGEGNKSMLYLNAVETTEKLYIADRTRFFLFIIPLPGGGGKEATSVKEGEKIVEDRQFYQKFFTIIEQEIDNLEKSAQKLQ